MEVSSHFNMKYFFFVLLILQFKIVLAQEEIPFFPLKYTNANLISLNKGYESRFSNDTLSAEKGFGFEITSLHGLFITRTLAISVGTGLDWNINKTHLTNPILGDIRWYLKTFGERSPYVFLNVGKNIHWGNNFSRGTSAKIGIGLTFEITSDKIQGVVEVFRKTKTTEFNNALTYDVESFGISIGMKI